jgi:hypothetical protein
VIRGGRADLAPDAPKDTVNVNFGFIIAYALSMRSMQSRSIQPGPYGQRSSSVVQGGAKRPGNPGTHGHRGNLESVS